MKSNWWHGTEIRGMIRTMAVDCASIHNCSKNDGKTPVEAASDEMTMGALKALCEFFLLLSQQNHSDLSLTAPADALKRFYKKKDAIQNWKLSKFAKVTVNEHFAIESHQLRKSMIHNIPNEMEVLVYGAENIIILT